MRLIPYRGGGKFIACANKIKLPKGETVECGCSIFTVVIRSSEVYIVCENCKTESFVVGEET